MDKALETLERVSGAVFTGVLRGIILYTLYGKLPVYIITSMNIPYTPRGNPVLYMWLITSLAVTSSLLRSVLRSPAWVHVDALSKLTALVMLYDVLGGGYVAGDICYHGYVIAYTIDVSPILYVVAVATLARILIAETKLIHGHLRWLCGGASQQYSRSPRRRE